MDFVEQFADLHCVVHSSRPRPLDLLHVSLRT
jgi:hypothetical protein